VLGRKQESQSTVHDSISKFLFLKCLTFSVSEMIHKTSWFLYIREDIFLLDQWTSCDLAVKSLVPELHIPHSLEGRCRDCEEYGVP